MTERVRATIGIPGLPYAQPAGRDVYQFESPGFMQPPTSVETLRHIADVISGDGAVVMQGILRKAAHELEAAEARLRYLIDNDAYVIDRRGHRVIQACWGDDEELTPYNKTTGGCGWESAEAAIDAARLAK